MPSNSRYCNGLKSDDVVASGAYNTRMNAPSSANDKPADRMTPEWSQEAAEILNAPYFSDVDESLPGEAMVAAIDRLDAEHNAFQDAAIRVPSADHLPAEMKRIYDAARESIVNEMAQDDFFDRIYDEPISYTFLPPGPVPE
jgi:hypothetical protein